MPSVFFRILLFWGVLAVFSLAGGGAFALEVKDLRFGVHPDKTRMVLELSDAAEFKAFALSDPYRIVVDLPTFQWRVASIQKPPGDKVREVRQGRAQPGISRIVVDLPGPAVLKTAFVLPGGAGQNDRLVIDFQTVSAGGFAAGKDTVLGRLNTGPTPDTRATEKTASAALIPLSDRTSAQGGMVSPQHKPPSSSSAKKPVIVIDPGHGGQDPGATGANRVQEKRVVFSTALELKRQLEATGLYTVKMTRTSDTYIKLHKRVEFARRNGADLFISLHADSIHKAGVRGASVYTLSDKASDEQTARLAARENQADLIAGVDLSHEDKEVANILIDLARRDTMNQSKFFANTLVEMIGARSIRLLPRPHRYAGFAVLKAPDIPSVLIEMGFMSNDKEAGLLSTPEYRRKVAASIVDGVNVYFTKVRKNDRT